MFSAKLFWERFCDSLVEGRPQGYGKAWTLGIYRTLHRAQGKHFWCQCEKHLLDEANPSRSLGQNGERLNIDFLWFPPSAEHEDWIAPLVAIEHENLYESRDRSVDHWKVSLIAAPLRVFIGYVKEPNEIEAAAKELRDRESCWHAVEGGQSLIILGHAEMEYPCFRGWWSLQGKSDWSALYEKTEACDRCQEELSRLA